jgi:hypothetical protein
MVESTEHLKAARAAFSRADWGAACDGFRAASERSELGADDLNALGDAAWWLGDVDAALTAYEGAYRLYLQGAQPRQAAVSAVGLAVSLFLRGDVELNAGNRVEDNVNVLGRFFYSASSFICVPNALSQGGRLALGAQAGEAALREVALEAGFSRVRRAADSPFNLVLEVRP